MSLYPARSRGRAAAFFQSTSGRSRVAPYPPRAAMTARALGYVSAHFIRAARCRSPPARPPPLSAAPAAVSGTNPAAERRASPRASLGGSTGPPGATTAITSPFRSGAGGTLRTFPPEYSQGRRIPVRVAFFGFRATNAHSSHHMTKESEGGEEFPSRGIRSGSDAGRDERSIPVDERLRSLTRFPTRSRQPQRVQRLSRSGYPVPSYPGTQVGPRTQLLGYPLQGESQQGAAAPLAHDRCRSRHHEVHLLSLRPDPLNGVLELSRQASLPEHPALEFQYGPTASLYH